jgi:hypothetical protein
MTDWITKEVQGFAQAEAEAQHAQNRRNLIAHQSPRLWGDLTFAIKDATNVLNQTPELRKRTGELKCVDGYTYKIEVHKMVIPAIYLSVINHSGDEFGIERKMRAHVDGPITEQRETLQLVLNAEDQVAMRNKDGRVLTIDDAVHYLFEPFLHPELLGIKK